MMKARRTNAAEKSAPGAVELYLERFGRLEPDLFCPEILAYNTLDLHGLWTAIAEMPGNGAGLPEIPYWGIVWPGARALARYVLDHPEEFRGKRVLDLACGSGMIAAAAAYAGALVTGVDKDADAVNLAVRTAQANGLNCRFVEGDIFELPETEYRRYDAILTAEVFHTEELAGRSVNLLRNLAPHVPNYVGDCGRQYRPADAMIRRAAEFSVPVHPEIEGVQSRQGLIFQILP